MQKNRLDLGDRLVVWQELLTSPEGATYDSVCKLCGKKGKEHYTEYSDTVRKDVEKIKELLEGTDCCLLDSGTKKNKSFYLSNRIDLVSLYNQSKVMKPYQNLFRLLERMEGFLPDSILSGLSDAYKEIKEKQNMKSVVSFETDYKDLDSMRFFSDVYKAINKYGLLIERRRLQKSEDTFRVIIYPEYLKQYNSEWYVFGVVTDENGVRESDTCSRIPLSTIESVKSLTQLNIPFIESGTDYDDYFYDILGVENDQNCEVETIELRVSKKMFNRLQKYPIHDSQRECKDISTTTMRGIAIQVKRNKELIRKLLAYGQDIEVVKPVKLRTQIKKELGKTLNMYL